jgi:hypothetical protein
VKTSKPPWRIPPNLPDPGEGADLGDVQRGQDVNDRNALLTPSKAHQEMARYIAMVVRNEMEDFHCEHLSDAQMKELNPLIRNAICTALHAASHAADSDSAGSFVRFHTMLIPDYWEPPSLTNEFLQLVRKERPGNSGRSRRETKAKKRRTR